MENMCNEGKHNCRPVSELTKEMFNGLEPKTGLPHKSPILYRWWFSRDSKIVKLIENINKDLLAKLAQTSINDTIYYALYLGKGVDGRRRLKNHIGKYKRLSTLRRTIGALLNTDNEDKITEELQQCYFEWCELSCTKEELGKREEKAIKDGYYPLNLSDNTHIDPKWRDFLQHKRQMYK